MKVLYIPSGPKNLQPLFPGIDFSQMGDYHLELLDATGNVVATSNHFVCENNCDDTLRIHFLNRLGTIDAINFKKITEEHQPTSDSYTKPVTYPLQKDQHAISRFNVTSNDDITATNVEYGETEMDWIKEFFDSPLAWLEWKGTQGQPDSYIPIVFLDKKLQTQKEDERYTYEITIEFKLSHEFINIRN